MLTLRSMLIAAALAIPFAVAVVSAITERRSRRRLKKDISARLKQAAAEVARLREPLDRPNPPHGVWRACPRCGGRPRYIGPPVGGLPGLPVWRSCEECMVIGCEDCLPHACRTRNEDAKRRPPDCGAPPQGNGGEQEPA